MSVHSDLAASSLRLRASRQAITSKAEGSRRTIRCVRFAARDRARPSRVGGPQKQLIPALLESSGATVGFKAETSRCRLLGG